MTKVGLHFNAVIEPATLIYWPNPQTLNIIVEQLAARFNDTDPHSRFEVKSAQIQHFNQELNRQFTAILVNLSPEQVREVLVPDPIEEE